MVLPMISPLRSTIEISAFDLSTNIWGRTHSWKSNQSPLAACNARALSRM